MEINAPDWAIVLLEAVYEGSHAVVPELDGRRVQRDQDPWALRVEGNALCARGFAFELGQHVRAGGGGHGGLWKGSPQLQIEANAQQVQYQAQMETSAVVINYYRKGVWWVWCGAVEWRRHGIMQSIPTTCPQLSWRMTPKARNKAATGLLISSTAVSCMIISLHRNAFPSISLSLFLCVFLHLVGLITGFLLSLDQLLCYMCYATVEHRILLARSSVLTADFVRGRSRASRSTTKHFLSPPPPKNKSLSLLPY